MCIRDSHWVDAKTAVPVTIRNYDYLFVENDQGEEVFNENSLYETVGYAEPSITNAKAGDRYQFVRHGYYIADSELTTDCLLYTSSSKVPEIWKYTWTEIYRKEGYSLPSI